MRRFIVVGVVAGLMQAAVGCSPAVEPGPSMIGPFKVIDSSANPIGGASVILADHSGITTELVTDNEGVVSPPEGTAFVIGTVDFPNKLAVTIRRSTSTVVLHDDPAPEDSDNDGLSDGEESEIGSDPLLVDTDNDGIDDGKETNVTGPFSPVALDASPLRRDMFVEVDWWEGLGDAGRFDSTAQHILRTAFRDSSLLNPDGTYGIEVHIDAGEFGGGTAISVPPQMATCSIERPDPLRLEVAPERRDIFFHATVVPIMTFCGLSGIATARRSVLFNERPADGPFQAAFWAGVLVHELGHTLGLRHGGFEDLNCKPNYPSSMNYDIRLMVIAGRISFSRGLESSIDESAIQEGKGLLGYPSYDLNHNGRIDRDPYAMELNDGQWMDPLLTWLFASATGFDPKARCVSDGSLTVLKDNDDWSLINKYLPNAVGSPLGEGSWFPTNDGAGIVAMRG